MHIGRHDMLAGAAALGSMDCRLVTGIPAEVNVLAAQAPHALRFLREAWFSRGDPGALSTLVARRCDGTPVLALPLRPIGPKLLRARAIAGSYWPFRSIAMANDTTVSDIAGVFDNPIAQSAIGPLLRLGPIYDSDPLAVMMVEAARTKGWSVLVRQMGQTFIQDIVNADGTTAWPSTSRRRKMRRFATKLADHGPVTMRIVRGADWSNPVFADLARIEAHSWVGTRTDRSGAKFLNPAMMAHWQSAVADPAIAEMLAAAILYVGDTPIAFSLDLTTGPLQYGIASSYDLAFAAFSPGQIITVHAADDSIARGVRQIDWGSGDSGYKQDLGAKPGALIHDMLIVRNPRIAALLRPKWEETAGSTARALATGLADALKA